MNKAEAIKWCEDYLPEWPGKIDILKPLARPLAWNWSHNAVTKEVILICGEQEIFESDIWVKVDEPKVKTKYEPRGYMLIKFSEVGGKEISNEFFVDIDNDSDLFKAQHPGKSTVISKILFNSSKPNVMNKWSYKG